MAAGCCEVPETPPATGMRRVLVVVLAINITMFAVEVAAGLEAHSQSLLADALDFLADSFTYGISLLVLNKGLQWRAGAALIKGITMAVLGCTVLVSALAAGFRPPEPHAAVMGWVGVTALVANLGSALLLYRFRDGDANIRSVWLCTRNDAINNIAVIAAAFAVAGLGSAWPDILVGLGMASLFLWGAASVIRQALGELRQHRAAVMS